MSLATGLAILAGACLGCGVNAAVYAFRRHPLPYSPWSRFHPPDKRANLLDFLPLVGWWRLRRHADEWGSGFWLRPLAVELLLAGLIGGLYFREVEQLNFPSATFFAHAILAIFMTAAAFIDIDEWIIPDEITLPGTLAAIVLAFVMPKILLPATIAGVVVARPGASEFVTATSPFIWPDLLAPGPNVVSLAIGLSCFGGWCAALLPRLWLPQRGWNKALRMLFAHIGRSPASSRIGVMFSMGGAFIAFAWWCGQERWTAVLSSLLGLAISGAVVWYVRIIGQWAMSKEAMGFGDVTLMAMIGAYLGWQAGVLVFFLAPLAAIGVSVVRLALWRDRSLPFGPYLCLTAIAVCVGWPPIWEYLAGLGEISWLVPASLAGCMLCLGPLMYVARRVSDAIVGRQEEPPEDGEPSNNSDAPAPGDDAPDVPPAAIEADAEQP